MLGLICGQADIFKYDQVSTCMEADLQIDMPMEGTHKKHAFMDWF